MPWRALPTVTIRTCKEDHNGYQACSERAGIRLSSLAAIAVSPLAHRGRIFVPWKRQRTSRRWHRYGRVGAKLRISVRQAEACVEYVAVPQSNRERMESSASALSSLSPTGSRPCGKLYLPEPATTRESRKALSTMLPCWHGLGARPSRSPHRLRYS
jgi:hypothetical protein